jgi:hypothetical protein
MTEWKPHIDLARLLEALSREIMATSDEDVRSACAEDERSIEAEVSQVSGVVAAVTSDEVGEFEANLPSAETADAREYRHRN